jgi:O-methyltransferase
VQSSVDRLGLGDYVTLVKGWFDQSLPQARHSIEKIALLRIDGDWHSSVSCCLENLYDLVVPGGFVVLDDYYAFEGCATATHEFLGARHLNHRLVTVANPWGVSDFAFFRKI